MNSYALYRTVLFSMTWGDP